MSNKAQDVIPVKYIYDPISDEEKLKVEIAKLRAEYTASVRPPYLNPTFLLAVFTAAASFWGIYLQSAESRLEAERAELTKARALQQVDSLTRAKVIADTALATAEARYAATAARVRQEEERLAKLAAALQRTEAALRAGQGVNQGAVEAIVQATALVRDAAAQSAEEATEAQNAAARVADLRTQFGAAPAADLQSRPTAIVTGGFASEAQARRDIDASRANGYTPLVFLRNGKIRTAILFGSRDSARVALPRVRERIRRSAYMVDSNDWCPGATMRQGVFACLPSEPEELIR